MKKYKVTLTKEEVDQLRLMTQKGKRNARVLIAALYETFAPQEAKHIWDRFEFIYTPNMGAG